MKGINTKRLFEITATIVLSFTLFSCIEENEKKISKAEADYDIEIITKANDINLNIKNAFRKFIIKSQDSLEIELVTEMQNNHNHIDSILYSVANHKLIVLSDIFFSKKNKTKKLKKFSLRDFKKYLEKQRNSLQMISQSNEDSDLAEYYQTKIEELEKNINRINAFLETQNKPNY